MTTALLLIALVTPATSTHLAYDELGRVIHEYGNNGQSVRYTYDPNGNVSTITRKLSATETATTTLAYDALDRLVTATDALNGITRLTYDTADRLTKVTDPRTLVTTYQHDGFGQLRRQTSPDTGTTTFTYNAYGQRTGLTRADGTPTTFGYDTPGRLKTLSAGGQTHTFAYDTCTNGKGRLCTLTDPTGSVSYTYTPQGQIATQTSLLPAGGSATLSYSYDGQGRLSRITYPDTTLATYTYTAGHVSAVNATLAGVSRTVASNLAYEPYGPVTNWTYGNGLTRGLNYDTDGRLTGLSTGDASTVLQSLTYAWDTADQITAITNAVLPGASQHYVYDKLGRLEHFDTGYGEP